MIIPLRQVASKYSLEPMTRVLHVGGHYGEEFGEYMQEGAAWCTWIEPQHACFAEMHRRIGHWREAELYHVALGNFNGRAMMHIETDNAGQSSSLLKPKLHATQYPTIRFQGDYEYVAVMRADDLLRPMGTLATDKPHDFLALDVQGYELEVLKGATETLAHIRAISAEINREELYEGCALVGEVDAFLALHGFERVETEWCGGTWGEGIYVRRRPA